MRRDGRRVPSRRGEIVGAFPRARFDREAIMRTAFRAGDAA